MNRFPCNYGSGAVLSLGENSSHVVIQIAEDGKKTSVALTPANLMALAMRLSTLAGATSARAEAHMGCKDAKEGK